MSASLISRSGSSAFSAIRVRGHWPTKILVEGEELQTNLLQASQRGPASSSVLDEVFGTHSAHMISFRLTCFGAREWDAQKGPG
jgi:hypothetical protein